ncbi:WGR domain-containing protein (plasmid) [Paenibacillus thiaminolyticus]|uniref:WGR domain-containing protein n=1 Tax=Paenibacillus thiaminolyticus TaxID=49283 RepID=UPI00232B866B|nr:WGR domain-containing protein [Paenibacillus thiaminolyticus]WCF11585.1 WGR domain-containing protein [Paenibacillus thiaminolyticus]
MASAVAANLYSFTVTKVHEKMLLNSASIGKNANKFYIIELQEGTGGPEPYRIYTENGRIGAKTPQKRARWYSSYHSAFNEYHRIIDSKKKGSSHYKEVELDDSNRTSAMHMQMTVKTKAKNEDLSEVKDKVLRLIGKLYQNATSYLVKSIDTPLGKLSASQVAKGLQVLSQIESLLDRGIRHGYDIERLSDEFYSEIPVKFGLRVDVRKFIIDDYLKLNDRKDLLGVMNSVLQAQTTLEKTLKEKYRALNIKLKALSSRSKEFKRLVDFVQKTKGHNHHFGFEIKEIYEVIDMKGRDRFNPYNVDVKELFHGSRNENILSIMQSGLKIKPKSAVHTGSMFGSGIYFADQSTKSANYCWGFDGGRPSEENYLFVCDVATGRIKEYSQAQPHLAAAPRPFNSVKGVKGPSLIHNEYIVYNESQVKIKYIIEFKKTSR